MKKKWAGSKEGVRGLFVIKKNDFDFEVVTFLVHRTVAFWRAISYSILRYGISASDFVLRGTTRAT